MITLYAKDATDFTTNGLGVLDGGIATVPEVEEAFNGAYTLTLRYVSWGRYRDLIDYDCIIKAPTPDGDQRFRIYKITKQIGFVEIVANHVFYDLAGNFIEDANLVDQNGGDALNHIGTSLQSPTNFTFKSNIETTASARLVRLNAVQALLDTSQDNSFVNRWGGELLRDNYQIIFNAVRGSNRGFSVKYGKNLTSYEATIDTTSVVTRIMPYGYDGLMIPEKYVDSDLIDKYPFVHVKKIEYSEIKAIDPESNSNDDTAVPLEDAYALLRAAAQNEYTTNHIDQPQANFKVSFQDLQKTREYADFEALETLLPWDYVNVDADGLQIDARMISYRYDPLNRRYIEVELGNYVSEYTDTVAGKVDSLTSSLMKVSEQASHAAVSANGKNTNYYGTATPPNPVDGDLWYKQNGDSTELWQYDGKSVPPGWKLRVSDLTGQEISDKVDNALKEVDAAKQAADKAVEQANIAVTQSGLSQESAKAAAEAVQAAQAIAQEVSASLAAAQAQAANAAGDAAEALKEAQDALAAANGQSAQVKSLQQIVDDTTGTISTLAKQVDVDTVTQQVKTTQTLAQQTANGLLLKSDQSVVDTLSGAVKQQSIELKAAQDQLALRLTAGDLTKGLSGYATQTWASQQITATATGLEAKLTTVESTLDNLQVGSRNYLLNSDVTNSGIFSSSTGGTYTDLGIAGATTLFNSLRGKTVTVSVDIEWSGWQSGSGFNRIGVEWIIYYTDGSKFTFGAWEVPSTQSKAKHRINSIHVMPDKDIRNIDEGRFYIEAFSAATVGHAKIEVGNMGTDWTPAPEDSATYTDTKVADLKLTVDGLSATFATKSALQTVSAKVDVTSNGLSSLTNKVTAQGTLVTSLKSGVDGFNSTVQALQNLEYTARNYAASAKIGAHNITISGTTKSFRVTAKDGTNYTGWNIWSDDFEAGQTYVCSFDFHIVTGIINGFGGDTNGLSSATLTVNSWSVIDMSNFAKGVNFTPTAAAGKYHFVLKFVPNLTSASSKLIYFQPNRLPTATWPAFSADITDFMIAKGNEAAWSPAPEDQATSTQMTAITQTLTGVQTLAQNAATKAETNTLAGQITSTATDLKNRLSTQNTQLTNMINLRVTKTDVQSAIDTSLLSNGQYKDTRNDNQPPSWYWKNYPKQTAKEFKFTATLGFREDNYAALDTIVPWTDDTGGPIKQTARTSSNVRVRYSTSTTTWSPWVLTANTSNVISQINVSTEGVLIDGAKNHITGATTIDNAVIKSAMIDTITADKIITGTLNAGLVNVVGLNAKSITTGTITGENLSINLGTGEVTFAKGAIKSANGRLNIDVNDGTFAQSDGTKGMLFAGGNLYLSSASWWDQVSGVPYTKPDYGFIGYTDTLLTARGFGVIGRDALTLGLTDNGNPGMEYTASPVITMSRSNVTLNFSGELATIQAGKGFTIKTNSIYNVEQIPGIQIGSNVGRTGIGDRVFIDGSYVYIPSAYDRTTSGSANLIVAADGALVRTSSATKYKSDIQRFSSTDAAERFLEVPQAHWLNKQDLQRYSDDPQHYKFPKYDFGMIAEDLAAKGLEDFVVRGTDGQLEDIRYDRIAPALLPLIKEMKLEIDTLKEELKS